MKLRLLITFMLLTLPSFGWADNDPTDGSDQVDVAGNSSGQQEEEAPNYSKVSDYQLSNDPEKKLQLVLQSNAKAKANYDVCLEHRKKGKTVDMSKCIWEGTDEAGAAVPSHQPLDDKDKEEIAKLLQPEGVDDKNGKGYENANYGNIKTTKDPALAKLEDYYTEELKKALSPEETDANGKKIKKVNMNHTVFNDLFRSQLGKNIVRGLTSYCIEADLGSKDPNTGVYTGGSYTIPETTDGKIDEAKAKDNREANLKALAEPFVEEKKKDDNGNEVGTGRMVPANYVTWNNCIINIKKICYKEGSFTSPGAYTQGRACEVTNFIKAARRNLLALDKLDANWDKRSKEGQPIIELSNSQWKAGGGPLGGSLVATGSNVSGNANVDKLTNISSNEFAKKSGYEDEMNKIKDEAAECVKNYDAGRCAKFVDDKGADSEKLATELDVRSRAMEARIDKEIKDEDSVKAYLAEEGYKEDQIDALLKEGGSIDDIKQKIKNRYKNQREAMHKALMDRIDKNQVNKDKITATNQNPDAIKKETEDKMKHIADELAQKTNKMKQLIYFNNIVSGFLKFEGKDGGANTAAIQREMSDSAFAQSAGDPNGGRTTASAANGTGSGRNDGSVDVSFEAVEQNIQSAGIKTDAGSNNNNAQTTSIDVGTINDNLLNYKDDQSKKKADPGQ